MSKEEIEKLRQNISLHMNPYNLGDMGETSALVLKLISSYEQKEAQARKMEILAFYWGQDSPYFEFSHYESSPDYGKPKP